MPYQTGLVDALKRRGLTVEVVPGWETRGSASFNPKGAVSHWTAGPKKGDRPSLRIVVEGRVGLPGPLCNVFLTRAGVAVVVAAGRANHAGKGGWRGLVGNSAVFGTEAESSGTGDWTAAQRHAYPRVNAAFCDLGGFSPDMVCGHNEWATPPGRKIDIRDWPMATMRADVARILTDTTGEEDMPLTDDDLARIAQKVWTRDIKTTGGAVRSAEAILAGVDRRELVDAVLGALLDTPIDRADLGSSPTSLRQVLRWSDRNTDRLARTIEAAAVAAADAPQNVGEAVRKAVADAVRESYDATLTPKQGGQV